MTDWVLIIWIFTGHGGGVDHVNFYSFQACAAALEQAEKNATFFQSVRGLCVNTTEAHQ